VTVDLHAALGVVRRVCRGEEELIPEGFVSSSGGLWPTLTEQKTRLDTLAAKARAK
jgi:hypothetical protein